MLCVSCSILYNLGRWFWAWFWAAYKVNMPLLVVINDSIQGACTYVVESSDFVYVFELLWIWSLKFRGIYKLLIRPRSYLRNRSYIISLLYVMNNFFWWRDDSIFGFFVIRKCFRSFVQCEYQWFKSNWSRHLVSFYDTNTLTPGYDLKALTSRLWIIAHDSIGNHSSGQRRFEIR